MAEDCSEFETLTQFKINKLTTAGSNDNSVSCPPSPPGENLIMTPVTRADVCACTVLEVIQRLKTDKSNGLSTQEASKRRMYYGSNDFDVGTEKSLILRYLEQFKEPMIILLLVSGVVSMILGQLDDAVSIFVAVAIVVTVAFIQEYRSDKSVEAITKLVPPTCKAIRDGSLSELLADELVAGDVVALGIGDRVPADLRLIEVTDLTVDESSFTGETEPCVKTAGLVVPLNDSITNAHNIAFMGTLVRTGHAKGIVFGTGLRTEFGSVFKMMKEEEPPKTPLQRSMDSLGKQLSTYSLTIIAMLVVLGWMQHRQVLEMFTIGVSLAVAAIPEGLPIVVTVTLALGIMRMAKKNAIVRKLPVVETLGCATVVCSDKTGTLTKNQMTVTLMHTASGKWIEVFNSSDGGVQDLILNGQSLVREPDLDLMQLVQSACICNNATFTRGHLMGQSTEGAIYNVGLKLGFNNMSKHIHRLEEIPFSSETKWMAVRATSVENMEGQGIFHVKGAPERILSFCTDFYDSGVCSPISPAYKDRILMACSSMGNKGLRVLAVAYGDSIGSLTFLGLFGLVDPPRQGVKESIEILQRTGVSVKMLTGDAMETAVSIASLLGIMKPGTVSLSGNELDQMDEAFLRRTINHVSVFYRVTPKHKVLIIKALQSLGHVVAMTGDGVNDAVALKSADIGITMGKSGTDVCKEAADMILVDDDFKTILSAVEEGKCIYHNIRNFVRFQLSTSIAAIAMITVSTMMALPNPLNAMQILWINIIMDGPPAQSLGVEPVDDEILLLKPRDPKVPMITRRLAFSVVVSAFVIVAGVYYIFLHEMSDGSVTQRDTTMTFTCFVMFDMFNALSCRSLTKSVFSIGLLQNRAFLFAVLGSMFGQLLVIYWAPLQAVFQTEAISLSDLLRLTVICSSVLWADEIRKLIARRWGNASSSILFQI